MINFILINHVTVTTVAPSLPHHHTYTLEQAAEMVGMHADLLRYYCQTGLLGQQRTVDESELEFDDDALYRLRRIEYCRSHHGVNIRALPLVFRLLGEIDSLHKELRFLRDST